MEEKVELANLLFELDKGEHTIPYEAWAEQILDAGWSRMVKVFTIKYSGSVE